MAEITSAQIAKLRAMTNAGMMDCKRALTETKGDLDAAVDYLRKKGMASAAKKALREAREGLIVKYIAPDRKSGVLVEVNCQTDFVARNEGFRAFCDKVAELLATNPKADLEALRVEQVAKTGENVQVPRHTRLEAGPNGVLAAYIHHGSKIGVLLEVGAGKAETLNHDDFKQLVGDITLQIAAATPVAVCREQVDPALVAKEREIGAEQAKGKPAPAVEKIIQGKLEKYFQTVCLVDQGFVKRNGEVSVKEHAASVGKALGDTIEIRRFVRYQLGDSISA